MQSTEKWLPVVGYEGIYEVSDLGRVSRTKGGSGARAGRLMKPVRSKTGYLSAGLSLNGELKIHRIHKLVLTAFVGPAGPGQECRHLDGDPTNNALQNLAWGTHSENMRDKVTHGTHHCAARDACPLGHLLQHPNLVESELKRRNGSRSCKACGRARARAQYWGKPFDPVLADEKYLDILAGVTRSRRSV